MKEQVSVISGQLSVEDEIQNESGTRGEIRTLNLLFLRQAPLPVGLHRPGKVNPARFELAAFGFVDQRSVRAELRVHKTKSGGGESRTHMGF